MATAVVMPKQGNTVESCIIVNWKKRTGDLVAVDDVLCEVETDKATMEVPSPVAGTLLATFFQEGDDVPVMVNIAAIGRPGEDVTALAPVGATVDLPGTNRNAPATEKNVAAPPPAHPLIPPPAQPLAISPRARRLAESREIDPATLAGSGPGGRVIERDVQAAAQAGAPPAQPKLTPVAKAMIAEGGYTAPAQGSGPGGRVMSKDLVREGAAEPPALVQAGRGDSPAHPLSPSPAQPVADEIEIIPIKGVRKVIAERMLQSLQTTAQLTLHASADARALQRLRARLKAGPAAWGLAGITINDLVLLAAARTLPQFGALNALFSGDAIHQYRHVHLGVAVDTPRGLLVPVIRNADTLSLRALSAEARRLAAACQAGKVLPDELTGGTFTVTNLGALGVEMFTPVLNTPQVAILGVCSIQPKPLEVGGEVQFVPHIGLSLTINHQVVDGAPAARFLGALGAAIADIDLVLAG